MQAYTSPRQVTVSKRLVLLSLGVVVATVIILIGFFYNRHEIRIYADGKETNLIMRGGTVADAIKKAAIPLGQKDIVDPPLPTVLNKDLKIRITRLVNITLIADGKTTEHWVPIASVDQILKKLNIAVNSGDQVIPDGNKIVSAGAQIEVIRFSERLIQESIDVPYKVERRNNSSMERGVSRVVQQGKNGLIQRTIKITLKNGKEIKREVISDKVIREPVNKIVAVGTLSTKTVSRGGTLRFSKALTMSSTAYTHTGNRTATGVYPRKGTVAVDPKVIPLGTKLYIEGYGYATAQDVGSSIKGNRIDVFFETEKECRNWGRRTVKVYILQ